MSLDSAMLSYPETASKQKEVENNPPFGFYGKRLYKDQTLQEFLNEFLLVLFSSKRHGGRVVFTQALPPFECLTVEDTPTIEYAPKARLNVKLLAFWGTSRLDARAREHMEHHEFLRKELAYRITHSRGSEGVETTLQDIESLLLGFRSAGGGRTWCAQQFLPITESLLSAETLWNETEAKRNKPDSWYDTLESFAKYWSFNKHRFMARGGEVLYLQLCCALSQSATTIAQWNKENALGLNHDEENPCWLYTQLQKNIPFLMAKQAGIESLIDFLEGLEFQTADYTDTKGGESRYQELAWCSAHSWQEGYLFALELLRITQAKIDPVDKLSLLETLCAMQIIRTLCMRTVAARAEEQASSWPHYILAISNIDAEKRSATRELSHRSFKAMQTMIYTHILSAAEPNEEGQKRKIEKSAQDSGNGLLAKIAKDLGLVIPKTGSNERFVLPERVLRLFIITLVPAGKSMRLDTFKDLIRKRYGFVFDAVGFDAASRWISQVPAYLDGNCDAWLQNMLENANCLVRLSDSCSLVRNATFTTSGEEE